MESGQQPSGTREWEKQVKKATERYPTLSQRGTLEHFRLYNCCVYSLIDLKFKIQIYIIVIYVYKEAETQNYNDLLSKRFIGA